jgi:hypothetical protein
VVAIIEFSKYFSNLQGVVRIPADCTNLRPFRGFGWQAVSFLRIKFSSLPRYDDQAVATFCGGACAAGTDACLIIGVCVISWDQC